MRAASPWLVGHFVQIWPDSECSHTVQFLDCRTTAFFSSGLCFDLQCSLHLFLALYDPFGVDVPLNIDILLLPSGTPIGVGFHRFVCWFTKSIFVKLRLA